MPVRGTHTHRQTWLKIMALQVCNRTKNTCAQEVKQNKPVGFYGPIAPAVPNAPELRSQHDAAPPVQLQYSGERRAAAAMPLPKSPYGQTSKCISSVSFVGIASNFFTIHRRHRRKKCWTRILKFEFCDFCEFF